jgi:flagellar assembly protein FliH
VTAPLPRPSFMSSLAPVPEARPTQFQHATSARPAARPPVAYRRPEARGPTPEELAAIRADAMQRVAHAVEVLRLQSDHLAEQARSDALEIGFMVARRILAAELSTGPEALFGLVRSALQKAGDSRKIVIRLHPEEVALVAGPAATGDLGVSSATIEVVGDPSLAHGDVMIDTDFGAVDGRLRTRLDELHRSAVSALEEGAA